MTRKKQYRLNDEQAIRLGLELKSKSKDKRNAKYALTEEQRELSKKKKPKIEDVDFGTITDTVTTGYPTKNEGISLNAWNHKTGKVMSLEEYCLEYSININHVTSYKRVDYQGTPTYNVACHITREIKEILDVDFLVNLVLDNIQPIVLPELKDVDVFPIMYADRLLYSDVHIGMDPDPEGIAPYEFKWNEDEIMHRVNVMINWVIANKSGSILIIDDHGDLLDGQDGETTRGGHDLPQNMTNRKAFSVGYRFKLAMADAFAPFYTEVIFNNVCNDNHSGDFSWMCNEKFKAAAEIRYENVTVNNQVKFLDHYEIFEHCKVMCHGKDKKNNKHGMKIKPDQKEITKIDAYLKHHNLYDGKRIEFTKGDNHLSLQDQSVPDFDYNNIPAFSPSSEYIQDNYSKGKSGFQLQHLNNSNTQVRYSPYWF